MIGAPHLPSMMWGLSDLYAAHVHNALPQRGKQHKSPHEMTTGRIPDKDLLFQSVWMPLSIRAGLHPGSQESSKDGMGMVCRTTMAYGSHLETLR